MYAQSRNRGPCGKVILVCRLGRQAGRQAGRPASKQYYTYTILSLSYLILRCCVPSCVYGIRDSGFLQHIVEHGVVFMT